MLKKKNKKSSNRVVTGIAQKLVKKYFNWKVKLGIVATIVLVVLILFTVFMVGAAFMGMVSTTSMGIWNKNDSNVTEHPTGCECGCIWISTNGQATNVETVLTGDGTALTIKGQCDVRTIGINNKETSSGAEKTVGITASITEGLLGLEVGDWIYISETGVYQVQDIIDREENNNKAGIIIYTNTAGTQIEDTNTGSSVSSGTVNGAVSVVTNGSEDGSSINKSIYLIEKGEITEGSQISVEKPKIDSSKLTIPGYGHTTGSLTDTSVEIPKFKYEKSETVIKAFLPGAVASYELYNVFPSVMIGQKIQESGYSTTSKIKNNFYGIKADASWTGDKGLYSTKEVINGKIVSTQAWFRHYETFSEGVLAHGQFLIENKRYAKAVAAKDGVQQITEIKAAGYATDTNYVNNIVKVMNTNNLLWFDNIQNAKMYMKEKGIYSEYEKIILGVQSGTIKVHEKANLGRLNNGIGVTGTLNGEISSTGSAGYWSCACPKPCPDCTCHDNETNSVNGEQNTGSKNTFPPSTPGQSSGLWGTYEELAANIEALNSSNMPKNTKNVEQLKKNLRELLQFVGTAPAKTVSYKEDKFEGPDGIGFVHYGQGSGSPSKEPYKKYRYNDSPYGGTFAESACGLYSIAMAVSTMEKTWCNPAEVAIALQTYGVRNGTRIETTQMNSSQSALITNDIVKFLNEAGFKAEKSSLSKSKLDDCLDADGIFMFCLSDSNRSVSIKTTGHFIVVRQRTASGRYLVGDSCRINDNEIDYKTLEKVFKHSAIYIKPRENSNVIFGDNIQSGDNTSGGTINPGMASGDLTIGQRALDAAKTQLGVPYVYGGMTEGKAFDCSGLVKWSYAQVGITLNRNSAAQESNCIRIHESQVKPGDIVFYKNSSGNVDHVGIWAGNGKIIHAPTEGQNVMYEEHKYMIPTKHGYFFGRPY